MAEPSTNWTYPTDIKSSNWSYKTDVNSTNWGVELGYDANLYDDSVDTYDGKGTTSAADNYDGITKGQAELTQPNSTNWTYKDQ